MLMKNMDFAHLTDYLSGVLIGHELISRRLNYRHSSSVTRRSARCISADLPISAPMRT